MKKYILNFIIIISLFIIVSQILTNSLLILTVTRESLEIWKKNIFPSLFPFFVISSLLINYGFVEIISEIFKPIMNLLFKTSPNSSFVFFMSIISGIPSNAKYINELLEKKMITYQEANKLLMFTHFSNPLFIIGTIGITLLNDVKLGILILIAHYSANIIIGIIIRNYYPYKEKVNFSYKNITKVIRNNNEKKSFINLLTNAIKDSINTLILILGIISFFLIISSIINNYFSFNEYIKCFICGIIEITQGVTYINFLNININIKVILLTMIISFGGISAHMQVMSILNNKKIRYLPYLISRILHVIISSIIIIILIRNYTN